ncbi:MAG TPA: DUF4845 domain-containing protein [Burkholderiales bacterium]|nr:DUF4845 domain-containing protein [Burkholderiales bacterium]
MWGLTFVLGTLAFFFFIGFKLFTPYMESFKVRSALDSLARQQDFPSMTRTDIATALSKRFEIDNIDDVKLDKALSVETRGRTKVVRLKYENVVPVVGNLYLLLDFDHSKETRSGE